MKLLWSSALLALSMSVNAITPSAQQIEQFKNLPKAQQEALAKQYGINLDSLNSPVRTKSDTFDSERSTTQPEAVGEANEGVVISDNKGIVDTSDIRDDDDQASPLKTLKLFGYDIFAGHSTGFEPLTNVPVPAEYVLGPGDELNVQMFGKEYQSVAVTIDRNGMFVLPDTGPISVAGLTFSEFKDVFNQQLENKVIGLKASVTMGALRSMRIFVLGEVNKPGAYTVSSLSTITHAIFSAGGISGVGSLRQVELKRRGKLITALDLYDLLMKGDTSKDKTLLPGDVVFVPPSGAIVGIEGEVKRPALYELKGGETAGDILSLAGNELPTAFLSASKIERVNEYGAKTVLNLDLANVTDAKLPMKNGDIIRVKSVLNELYDVVTLKGYVYRPGVYSWLT
jgi:protein involved in polysaccharide export with SLBB domain